jgi:hypothetical protein
VLPHACHKELVVKRSMGQWTVAKRTLAKQTKTET